MMRGWFDLHPKTPKRGADALFPALFLLAAAGVFGVTPAMAQDPCANETWTVSPTSFHFPASVNHQTVYTVNVSNSPASTYCQWTMGILAGSDSYWYTAGQNGQTNVQIHVDPNCPGQQPRSGTLLIFALDPHTRLPTQLLATISLTQDGVTLPALSNLKPNGGESYALGSHQTVTWSYTPSTDGLLSDTGNVWLLRNNLPIQNLGTVHLRSQSLAWTVPQNIFPTGNIFGINVQYDASDPVRYAGCAMGGGITSEAPFEIKNATATVTCPQNTGTVGILYSSSLAATGGSPPFTFSILNGALPAGLALNGSTGEVVGRPTSGGTASFTAQLLDSAGSPATAACTIVIDKCDFTLAGPPDVPGFSKYTYQVVLPAGKTATGMSWSADKTTASISSQNPAIANQSQALITFQNTTADWIGIKASFTLDGKKECAMKPVALVKVDVGPVNFTTPGKASERDYGHTVFLVDPPAAPAMPNWVTTNDPGSDWEKFIYNGKEQKPEPTEGVSSQLADHGAEPALRAVSAVTLTSPKEMPGALQRIQVGYIQNGSDSGSALYASKTIGQFGPSRIVTTPTSNTVDWLSHTNRKGDSDEWPWYDQSSRETGAKFDSCKENAAPQIGSWTCTLTMSDSPGMAFPSKYNPNNRADLNADQPIESARESLSFAFRMAVRTLDADLGADKHYFDEALSTWKTNFIWPFVPNVSIVSVGQNWTKPLYPTETSVNVVPTIINHNDPFLQFIPK